MTDVFTRRELTQDEIDYCHKMVDHLATLFQETHPDHGHKSEKHKMEKAHQALNAIGAIAGTLTEWAECQIFGSYYKVSKSNNHWIDEKASNKHDNEVMWYGNNMPDDFWTTDNDLLCERLAIAKILHNTFSRYGRMGWRLSLEDCLIRLNEGEQSDLLTPLNTRQHGQAFELQSLKWAAVKHLYKQMGETGIKKMSLQASIAEHCGVDYESIKKWEKECIKTRDREKSTLTAVRVGATYIAASRATDPNLTDQDFTREALSFNQAALSDLDQSKELFGLSAGILECLKLDKDFPLHTLKERLESAGLRVSEKKKGTK